MRKPVWGEGLDRRGARGLGGVMTFGGKRKREKGGGGLGF